MSNALQAMIDAMGETDRRTRANYHMTLGDLIDALTAARKTSVVLFSGGSYGGEHPTEPHSYRGYYSDLALSPSNKSITVADLLDAATKALDETFEGYKGGDFIMSADTPLWVAHYGSCGDAIVDFNQVGDDFFLITKDLDA